MILRINDRFRNRKYDFFTNFKLSLKYDSVAATFQLDYLFDPDNPEHKEFSCVGHYHLCTLEDNGQLIMTGIITSIGFKDSAKTNLASVAGYSLPGVLEDCEIPTSLYPLQSDGLTLKQIAEKLIKPFGLKMSIHKSVTGLMDEKYGETDAKETQSIKSYLSELAAQKNIIITHNEYGNLVFTKAPISAAPIFDFTQGMPGVEYALEFRGQGIHSQITAMAQADIEFEDQASEETINNPFCPIVFRPHVVTQSSQSVEADTKRTAMNVLANELKNIEVKITLDRWDLNGKIVKPGQIVSIENKRIYLYKKTNWIIDTVTLTGTPSEQTAMLTLVIPEVYNGQMPSYIWKGINIHYNG